ncbi:hypothetical protein ONS95_001453 [Cadophora gregata]|uniref:uncharacterized protein n=1 Tax=Cadophora gregata TaxID=51156 RepID=UPI0026DB4F3C|nr:uncharacterized protein ONS95_001453 [Cadophora gregata]KAK0111073.1 hypothetical protein ONS95_001453 [Cadophora gregata]KAK0112463.1 hypothetical protein ONS96_001700 [Cadophora gregata f. sp. sojae]
MHLEFMDGMHIPVVIALSDEEGYHEIFDGYRAMFNCRVYQKSFLDPALAFDEILRAVLDDPAQTNGTVEQSQTQPEYEISQGTLSAPGHRSYLPSSFSIPNPFLPLVGIVQPSQFQLAPIASVQGNYQFSQLHVPQYLPPTGTFQDLQDHLAIPAHPAPPNPRVAPHQAISTGKE